MASQVSEKRDSTLDDSGSANAAVSTNASSDIEKVAANTEDANSDGKGANGVELEWDGPNDPRNPLNWPIHKRAMQIICVALMTLLSNLAATMFAPGALQLETDFNFNSDAISSLTVSIYLIGYSLGPSLWAPLSETYGRLPIYTASSAVYCGFMIGCAFSTNLGMFIAFRILTGAAGSCPMALCGGTLADVFEEKDRNKWMGLFVLGPLAGPVIGPIAGGFIAQEYAVLAILCLLFLRETYGPVLTKQRKNTDTSTNVSTTGQSKSLKDVLKPLAIVIRSPMVILLSLYAAFTFGLQFILFTTFPEVFMGQYAWGVGVSGLAYLGVGFGMFSAVLMHDRLANWIAKSRADKNGSNVPEDRLPLMAYLSWTLPAGMFWYGWSTYYRVHWIVPILGTVLVGMGSVFIMMPQMVYLVQVFGAEAGASALAVNMIVRYIAGAFLPLAGPPMYARLGYGWGNSLLGFLGIAFMPLPWILSVYGQRIRTRGQGQV
ncbi:hypothetical protein J7T55_015280 [Diaporthe amygdali]|uniref:uncharacterized protein n=1 Tax=Phomopsis amygdali TaxID=1214568 RepID=UPI0022FF1C44|nr:uncharacterized protein J7T55_015280 [Diaporthe amygdali]KAJ0120551.1 hypothetical protein J7T55_015280 [Diaporthe amygdali]